MIVIPNWLREKRPNTARFCELINETLKDRPNMSLAAFAEQLSQSNIEDSYKRIQEAERRQFGTIK